MTRVVNAKTLLRVYPIVKRQIAITQKKHETGQQSVSQTHCITTFFVVLALHAVAFHSVTLCVRFIF